ncbi:MAG: molybdopterin-guanine dinucleotide biosynthesis protein B [Lautropia sp.]|nr:molybdopterin-guanine dinucleotide biosynthesis protein B [Lautropia sp.]
MKVMGFAGFSGSGKTTLIEQVIGLLRSDGLSVSVIKHAHHRFDIDKPGKDSWRHRQAGAGEVLLTSEHRWVLMHELGDEPEPPIEAHLARMSPCDLVLVEGFKHADIPKIEVHRPSVGKPLLYPDDERIVAVATDQPDLPLRAGLRRLDLNRPAEVADFVRHHLGMC